MPAKKRNRQNMQTFVKILTPDQFLYVQNNYLKISVREMATVLNVKVGSLRSILTRYKLGKPRDVNRSYLKQRFSVYKHTAVKRNLEFSLSLEDFTLITSKNCTYCNSLPKLKWTTKSRVMKYMNEPLSVCMNGIDRVDNLEGYTIQNSVPCCETCNKMKATDTVDDFVSHARQIVEFWDKK